MLYNGRIYLGVHSTVCCHKLRCGGTIHYFHQSKKHKYHYLILNTLLCKLCLPMLIVASLSEKS